MITVKLRVGAPVYYSGPGKLFAETRCPLCKKEGRAGIVDAQGNHAFVCCKTAGERTLRHDSVVEKVFVLTKQGGRWVCAEMEPHIALSGVPTRAQAEAGAGAGAGAAAAQPVAAGEGVVDGAGAVAGAAAQAGEQPPAPEDAVLDVEQPELQNRGDLRYSTNPSAPFATGNMVFVDMVVTTPTVRMAERHAGTLQTDAEGNVVAGDGRPQGQAADEQVRIKVKEYNQRFDVTTTLFMPFAMETYGFTHA